MSTIGGCKSLYPAPPSSKVRFLIPFTSDSAEAPPPPIVVMTVTAGGLVNL